ncbi:MAG: hypothetical protein HYV34_00410 [Candidatus Kerfeldbacteria bacterium]|nr:hypothetical protein [Candidatus Kerfeldbacteria bacterium]
MNTKTRWIIGALQAATVAVVLVAVLTVLAELVPALKDWLKATFSHHWIGKGVLALVAFVLVFLIASALAKNVSTQKLARWMNVLSITTVVTSLVIIGFFIVETVF